MGSRPLGVAPLQSLVSLAEAVGIKSDRVQELGDLLNAGVTLCEPVVRTPPAVRAHAHGGVATALVGALLALALALGALIVWLATRLRRRRRRVTSGAPRDAGDAAPEATDASRRVRLLVRPASGTYTEGTSLTRLTPRGYVLIHEHVAVLAEATSSELIDRDQRVVIEPH